MRLFALPISTRQVLIYCQRINTVAKEQSYIDRVIAKGSATWLNWEKGDWKWQRWVTRYGNKLFQRLPYEEWGLKSIPPLRQKRKAQEIEGKIQSFVEYPPTVLKPEGVQHVLEQYGGKDKQAYHAKWIGWNLVGMPLSAPAALVPVIPNLPFLYLCFRAWSHWRARSGSKHIEFLLDNKLLQKHPSSILDMAYAVNGLELAIKAAEDDLQALQVPAPALDQSKQTTSTPDKMLLTSSAGKLIADCLELPEIGMEIERAVWQVDRSLRTRVEEEVDQAKPTEKTT